MGKPLVGIVILNWNSLNLTRQCLEAVGTQSYCDRVIIVVDNGSTDGSAGWLAKQELVLIGNPRNFGFAKALNQGISKALEHNCEYVVSLNNDSRPHADWLRNLVDHLENNPEVGFAQGASMQMGAPKKYDSTGIYLEYGFIPRQRGAGKSRPELNIKAIGPNAAGAIYRRSMLERVSIDKNQFFDSRFFAYVEDVDFDLRCSLRGYGFAYVAGAIMFHHGSATGQRVARRKMFWGARNMVWLVYKNVPWPVFRRTARLIIKSHLANLQFLWREQKGNFLPYLTGLLAGLAGVPLFWRRRRANLRMQRLTNEDFLALLTPANPPLSNPLRRHSNLLK